MSTGRHEASRGAAPLLRAPFKTRTDDGWTLRGERIEPLAPRAVAVVAHAMMADRRTLDRPPGDGLVTEIARAGALVLCVDLRGHGESGPRAEEGARYRYDDFVERDLPALLLAGREIACARGLPLALVGHSLSAHAGLIAAGLWPRHAPDRIAAIAGTMWLPRFAPDLGHRIAEGALLGAWWLASLPRRRFAARRLRLGSADEPLSYVQGFVRAWWRDALCSADGARDYLAALGRVRVPVLAVASEGDRLLAPPAKVRRFCATIPHLHMRVVRRDEIDPPPGHMELVTDARCRPLWREIARFVVEGT
ncbi:MAG: alpha/beta fold hydrolase [Myxococcota bacterium]|nr:alpha/beta fold hydrolase [Myxococcota bacterium]MDW8361873.1 alpha/beta fold hydrolase [Myxococcales bacterium]